MDIEKIIATAESCRMSADDLISEAECVEEYGEYLHLSLMGVPAEKLRDAAQCMYQK